jgi:hypothetical protein
MSAADTANPASAAGAAVSTPPAAPSPAPAADPSSLRAELVTARLEGAGIDPSLLDLVAPLFPADQTPTKAAVDAFVTGLRKSRPALFGAGPAPAQTAPTPARAVPSAPAPGSAATPFQTWQALEASGRKVEAEAYYRLHRRDINRTAG